MHTFLQREDDNGEAYYSVGYWAPAKALVYGNMENHDDDFAPIADHAGEWMPLRTCKTAAEAASWVSYLNGGKRPDQPW
jgi:hypothetical protein